MALIDIQSEAHVEEVWKNMALVFDSDPPYLKECGSITIYPVVVASQGVDVDKLAHVDADIARVMCEFLHKQKVTVHDIGLLTRLMAISHELGAASLYHACHRALGETGDRRLSVEATAAERKNVLQQISACFLSKIPTHCDYSLKVPDEVQQGIVSIGVHKLLLSATSDFFSGKFSGSFDVLDEVIQDVRPSLLRALLNFVYTGKCSVSSNDLITFSTLADSWGMQLLRDCCLQSLATKWTPCFDEPMWSDCLAECIQQHAVAGLLHHIGQLPAYAKNSQVPKLSPAVVVDIVNAAWASKSRSRFSPSQQSSWEFVKQYFTSLKFSSVLTASNIGTWPPGVYQWLRGSAAWDRVFAADKLSTAVSCCAQFPHDVASDSSKEDMPLQRLLVVHDGLKGGGDQAALDSLFWDVMKKHMVSNVDNWLHHTKSEAKIMQQLVCSVIDGQIERFLSCKVVLDLKSEDLIKLLNTLYTHVDKHSQVCRKILQSWGARMVTEHGAVHGLCQVVGAEKSIDKGSEERAKTDWSVAIRSLIKADDQRIVQCLSQPTSTLQKNALAAFTKKPNVIVPLMLELSLRDLACCINVLFDANVGDVVTITKSFAALKQVEDFSIGDKIQSLPSVEFVNGEGKEFYLEGEFGKIEDLITNEKGEKRVSVLWQRTNLSCNFLRSCTHRFRVVERSYRAPKLQEVQLHLNESGQITQLCSDGDACVKFESKTIWVRRQDFGNLSLLKTDRLGFMSQLIQDWTTKSCDDKSDARKQVEIVLELFEALDARARKHCVHYVTDTIQKALLHQADLWQELLTDHDESILAEAASSACIAWDVAIVTRIAALHSNKLPLSLQEALKHRLQVLTTPDGGPSSVLSEAAWQNTLLVYQQLGGLHDYKSLVDNAVCQFASASLNWCVLAFQDPHFQHLQHAIAAATLCHLAKSPLEEDIARMPANLVSSAISTWSKQVPDDVNGSIKKWMEVRKPTKVEMPCTRLDNSLELHEVITSSSEAGSTHQSIVDVWQDATTLELASSTDCRMVGAFDLCKYILETGPERAATLAAHIAAGCLPDSTVIKDLTLLSAKSMAKIAQEAWVKGSWSQYMTLALAWSQQQHGGNLESYENGFLHLSQLYQLIPASHLCMCDALIRGSVGLMDVSMAIKMLNRSQVQPSPEQQEPDFFVSVALAYFEIHMDEMLSSADMLSSVHPASMPWLVRRFRSHPSLDNILKQWAYAVTSQTSGPFDNFAFLHVTWQPTAALLQLMKCMHYAGSEDAKCSDYSISLQGDVKPVLSAIKMAMSSGMDAAQKTGDEAASSCCIEILLSGTPCDKCEIHAAVHAAACAAACQCFASLSQNTRFHELPPAVIAQLVAHLMEEGKEQKDLLKQALLSWASTREAVQAEGSTTSSSNLSEFYKHVAQGSKHDVKPILMACAQHVLTSTEGIGIQWLSESEGPFFETAKLHYVVDQCEDLVAHPMLSILPPGALLRIMASMPKSVGSKVLQAWKDRRPGGWADLLPQLWNFHSDSEELVTYVRAYVIDELRCQEADESIDGKRRRISFEQEDQLRVQLTQYQAVAKQMQDLAGSMLGSHF